MKALLDISKKPKSNSKSIDQSLIDLAIQVRKDNYNAGAKLTTLLLKRDHGIEIHASTLGYIFRRKNISQQYRIPRKNSHTKRYAFQEPLERVQTDTVNLGIVDHNGHSREAGIEHKLIRPGTPELNGKVERFNQTLKRALEGKIKNGMSIIEIQTIVDNFVNWYNKIRPHSSLNNLTPYQRFHRNRMTKIAS